MLKSTGLVLFHHSLQLIVFDDQDVIKKAFTGVALVVSPIASKAAVS